MTAFIGYSFDIKYLEIIKSINLILEQWFTASPILGLPLCEILVYFVAGRNVAPL